VTPAFQQTQDTASHSSSDVLGETSASSDSRDANIINAFFSEGVFPQTLKHAIVQPRLKKPTLSPEDLNSFRPISNLSFVSKIVERVVVARLSRHTDAHHLLPSHQSTYRVNHSTQTAVIAVHDYIVRAIDSGEVCALVLFDLSSAFDTVDHETLLRVLTQRFGINDLALT
jgi:retron-type reverse transcriptase